ncbi:MAG: AMP-binding protein [Actinomycetota bacterium]|nr:AMP-binding protein [Actinomycetota bacterium]
MPATPHPEQVLTGPQVPMSELVLVDQHEAQGWRVRQDERLDQLFEERCDWIRQYGRAGQLAVDSEVLSLTYDELDARANRLARYLRLRGARGGDRVALLYDRPAYSYIAMLAVLKIGATYVPLDVGLPTGRLAYIVEDARVHTVLSMSHVAEQVEQIELLTASGAELVYVDRAAQLIEEMDTRRLIDAERGILTNQLAYISYASVSGRAEGVAIDHPSICNFVKVAAEVYGIRPRDRVYQGLPIALDFSVEEVWVPWVCGATLVPKPPGPSLLGPELDAFLRARQVTALCCVPDMLATLEQELPELRFVLMCGKDCPPDLIARWLRPGRRFLNVYGPTEATVTATWTELQPGKPATIGIPLPTYATVILDREDPYHALPHGEIGEIGIAGIGLACGYLNHDDLTEDVFIQDFLGIPANPSGRIYRTGDLGRVNADLEIEYHGPVDPQAERRGYRLELTEIEPLLHVPPVVPIDSIVLDIAAPATGGGLAGPTNAAEQAFIEVLTAVTKADQVSVDSHFFNDLGADSLIMAQFCARVRKRSDLPTVSMKDIYRFPTIRSLATALADVESTVMERSLAEVLAALVGRQVSVDSHFFDDLGADSLIMAQFCARVRKRVDLPAVSMKDIYRSSTIRSLASTLADAEAGRGESSVSGRGTSSAGSVPVDTWAPAEVTPPDTGRYLLCGTLQLLLFLVATWLSTIIAVRGFEWISAAVGLPSIYLRSLAFGAASLLALCVFPIAAKWLLIGRWKPQQFPVWSLTYVRFWLVKTLIRANPLALSAGSPFYTLYLRALGAKVGRSVEIFSQTVPVCTDLLTIGDGTVIRRESYLLGYRAHSGMIQIGSVTLGKDVLIGEKTVLDINTSMGDGAQLGHTSALHFGQAVPAGERWHGSPGERTEVDYRTVAPARCGAMRRTIYAILMLLRLFLLYLPLVFGGAVALLASIPQLPALLDPTTVAFTSWTFYLNALIASFVLYFGALLGGLLLVCTVPRVLNRVIRPDRVYCLYGVHYWVHRVIGRMTNVKLFTELFGDSSYIVGYLTCLGYKLDPVEQTGSNFGMLVHHESPYLSSVGTGTVVADGLSIINADYSSTSFRVSRTSIGRNNFLGNNIAYPAQGRTGDNCLLATKVMVPIDGEIRENVGLLGSPSFEIPRTVERDSKLDVQSADDMRRLLAEKNRYNTVTIGLRMLTRWIHLFGIILLFMAATDLYPSWGASAFALANVLTLLFTVVYFVLVERTVKHLQVLAPSGCSIYDRAFWRHERWWKVPSQSYFQAFDGTPFKNLLWRMLGVQIGRKVFDDGWSLTERAFTAIGDYCTLNAGSIVQCHSQEDDAFKSENTAIGAGCTLGVAAFVHYGVTMGDGTVLAPDSFLMKGEEVPPNSRWGGNPASEAHYIPHQPPVRSGETYVPHTERAAS